MFSVLHISDLHRDPSDPVGNDALLVSLMRDAASYAEAVPPIKAPTLCVVTGDLVYGVQPTASHADDKLARQYAEAERFLIGLADEFFGGDRERVILLPGNHDVSYFDVFGSSVPLPTPSMPTDRAKLLAEFFAGSSTLRWSWSDLCFYRIDNQRRYERRLEQFAITFDRFYQGTRVYPRSEEEHYSVFDFPELAFALVALSSCHRNDPWNRTGSFHPTALSSACREALDGSRLGWLLAAAWHHSVTGKPPHADFLDSSFLQNLIDAGVSLGFHGHQHFPDCVDERFRLAPKARKMTLISASTLCGSPMSLKAGVPRSFNVVELDGERMLGRVHQRQMTNDLYTVPMWGPGHFVSTGDSFVDFEICRPLATRPPQLDSSLALEHANVLAAQGRWQDAMTDLDAFKYHALSRPLLVRALHEVDDPSPLLEALGSPRTPAEAVAMGAAILQHGTSAQAVDLLPSLAALIGDASVREIAARLREWRKQ